MAALYNDNYDIVKVLLEHGANVNEKDEVMILFSLFFPFSSFFKLTF